MNIGNKQVKLPIPRPLFALAAADALIEAHQKDIALPKTLNREEVFAGIVQRDRDTIWTKAIPDDPKRRKYERGLALATYVQGLNLADVTKVRFGNAYDWLPEMPPNEDKIALVTMGCVGGHWAALEPDILGEYFFAKQILEMPHDTREAFLLGGLALGDPQPSISLLRLARDFGEIFVALNLPALLASQITDEHRLQIAKIAVDLTNIGGPVASEAIKIVEILIPSGTANTEIAVEAAKAAFNVTSYAGEAQDWDRVADARRPHSRIPRQHRDRCQSGRGCGQRHNRCRQSTGLGPCRGHAQTAGSAENVNWIGIADR